MNAPPPKRDDGGPTLLAKVAKQYAAKGEKSFSIGPHESRLIDSVIRNILEIKIELFAFQHYKDVVLLVQISKISMDSFLVDFHVHYQRVQE